MVDFDYINVAKFNCISQNPPYQFLIKDILHGEKCKSEITHFLYPELLCQTAGPPVAPYPSLWSSVSSLR